MNFNEEEIEKVYFTIGELAEMLDIKTSAIRYWGDEFPWTLPKWNKLGHRQYTRDNVNQILKLHFLIKTCGKTLQGIRESRIFGFYEHMVTFYEGVYLKECKQI